MTEADELRIFDRPTGRRLTEDWMPFPDSFVNEIPTNVAEEVLGFFDGVPVSTDLASWLSFLRGDVVQAKAQSSMFDPGA